MEGLGELIHWACWVLGLALISSGGYELSYLINTAFVHATFLVFFGDVPLSTSLEFPVFEDNLSSKL